MSTYDEIADNRNRYSQQVKQIQADSDLSPEGKRNALQRAYDQAQTRHRELVTAHQTVKAAEHDKLKQSAFGPKAGSDEAYHSAVQRAASAKNSQELLKMADLADLTGDRTMKRAIAAVGYDRGLTHVVSAVAGQDETVARLLQLEERPSPDARFAESMMLRGPERPAGI